MSEPELHQWSDKHPLSRSQGKYHPSDLPLSQVYDTPSFLPLIRYLISCLEDIHAFPHVTFAVRGKLTLSEPRGQSVYPTTMSGLRPWTLKLFVTTLGLTQYSPSAQLILTAGVPCTWLCYAYITRQSRQPKQGAQRPWAGLTLPGMIISGNPVLRATAVVLSTKWGNSFRIWCMSPGSNFKVTHKPAKRKAA